MRFGMIGQGLVERLLLASRFFPAPMLEGYAMVNTRALLAATRHGVFDVLAEGPVPAAEVAARCRTDPTATEKLLILLVGMRHLRLTRDGRYAMTARSRRWMTGTGSVRDSILMKELEWHWLEGLDQFVVSGRQQDVHDTMGTDEWRLYQRGMRSNAGVIAPFVAGRVPVPAGARDLLDVGGSHGFFSVALCRRHPQLRAVVLDLPAAVEQAEPLLAAEGMGDRVTMRAGDARVDDLGTEAFDVVFMASLVHHFDDATNRALMRRVSATLRPGGIVAIFEAVRLPPGRHDQVSAFFDLYFAMTSRAGLWSYEEMAAWQRDAGLVPRPPIRLPASRGNGLQVADKPA